jgi:hypothetical protein
MGFYLYGKKPDGKKGIEFSRNIWNWPTLWQYCVSVSPGVGALLGEKAYENSGHGLDETASKLLASELREQLLTGATQREIEARNQFDESPPALPKEVMAMQSFWSGLMPNITSAQPKLPDELRRELEKQGIRLSVGHHFDESDVKEFADFLEHCGGFEIW